MIYYIGIVIGQKLALLLWPAIYKLTNTVEPVDDSYEKEERDASPHTGARASSAVLIYFVVSLCSNLTL
jgi:hypothetical protein